MIRLPSRVGVLLAGALVLLSCTADATVITVGSPDGFLDCGDGEIPRSGDIFTSAGSEQHAVEQALAVWLEDGGSLAKPTEAEVWSVVFAGREVAIAIPEQEGDGDWVVADVRVCGQPDAGPAEVDGSIDCAGDTYWDQQAMVDSETPGEPTPDEAVRLALEPYLRGDGGEVVMIDENTGSLVVDDREQVVAHASSVPAGGWAVSTMTGCSDVGE